MDPRKPASPPSDAARVESLRRYEVLDTLPEQALDDLTALAAEICHAPMAAISLVDENRQWFKARVGLSMTETARDVAFCSHTVGQREIFVVPDATKDGRFAHFPLVTGETGVRFYAGVPLINNEDATLGALCVMDRTPRVLTPEQERALRILARQVLTNLELGRHSRALRESEERLRVVADNARMGMVIVDRDRRYLYANAAYGEMLGLALANIIGKRVADILPQMYEDQISWRLDLAFKGERVAYDLRRPTPAGDRHYAVRYEPRFEQGEVSMVVVVLTDITERKSEEISAQRLAAIVESSDDAIVSKTIDGIVTSWNPAAEQLFGYTAGEIIGRSITILFPSDRLHEEQDIVARISRGERLRHFETVRIDKEGRQIDVSATISPIRDADNRIVGVSTIVRDITERKEVERQLLWKTAFFEAQVNSALDGIMVVDSAGATILQNQRMLALWDFPPDLVALDDEKRRLEWAIGRVKQGAEFAARVAWLYDHPDEIGRDEIELVDGKILDRYTAPVRDREGRRYGRIWTFRDITERKRAEEKIAEQAAFLDKARDAILVADPAGVILFWNQGAERIYGWTPEEAAGQNLTDLLFSDAAAFDEPNASALQTGKWNGEIEQKTKDGRTLTIEARWTLIRDHAGQPKSVLAINTDITERKKIEAQFLRAQRMESIGTLAGGVAHDLNNILAPILMSIGMLKEMTRNAHVDPILATIETSAQRGAAIVRQVLSFARGVEGEQIEVQPKHILHDLQSIIENTFPKDIRLQFLIPPDIWTIRGDPTQIQQILLNLCVNARDAMPGGGTLAIAVENATLDQHYAAMNLQARPGRYVKLSVTDSGTGIPTHIINKIFEPFFTTKDITKGTGLGLSTVMAIVKSHGGVINVYSEPGRGTTFKVYLPALIAAVDPLKETLKEVSLPRGRGETVLVVDDEASILTITGQTLEAFGYRALTASDGADALRLFLQHQKEIRVVLTDMMMPVMDGPAMIHALRRIDPSVRIIAASGLKGNSAVATSANTGVRHFLHKPYTAETVLTKIRLVLDEA